MDPDLDHNDDESSPCIYCQEDIDIAEWRVAEKHRTMPPVNEYGTCTLCKRRRGIGCACGMTFAEKIKTVGLDEEALRIFNMGGKGRKRGKDHADNKRGA